ISWFIERAGNHCLIAQDNYLVASRILVGIDLIGNSAQNNGTSAPSVAPRFSMTPDTFTSVFAHAVMALGQVLIRVGEGHKLDCVAPLPSVQQFPPRTLHYTCELPERMILD